MQLKIKFEAQKKWQADKMEFNENELYGSGRIQGVVVVVVVKQKLNKQTDRPEK